MANVPSSLHLHEAKHGFRSRRLTPAAPSLVQNRALTRAVTAKHAAAMPPAVTWTAELARLPARALLALLWLYQRTVSPALPVIFGPSCGCRFAPTCSHYAVDAVREHGAFLGSLLALRRLIKCTPLHPGGFDPVPPRGKFSCTLIAHSPPAKNDPRIA